MAKVRIVGAISSKSGLTLTLEDGRQKNLPITSWRTKAVIDATVDRLAVHKVVELDLDDMSIHAHIEKETHGLLRFVKKTRGFVKSLFGATDEQSAQTIQILPGELSEAVSGPVEAETELVAVVTNEKTGEEVYVPGIEKLEKHIDAAVRNENVAGLKKFMERIATVAQKRPHTAQELLTFMERGDLPIANDGSIVAYKTLRGITGSGPKDTYVDLHSMKVKQRVGSKVMQDESMIDQDRRNECSTGLHIARRGYLPHFHGDVITIVKVAPEDVVAVPPNEPNKMRAAAYHIVGFIPPEMHHSLLDNKPMTEDPQAAALLADVIAGNHVEVEEIVTITKPRGGACTITPVKHSKVVTPGISGFAKTVDSAIEGVTPKEIRAKAKEAIAKHAAETEASETIEPQGEVPAIESVKEEAKPKKTPAKRKAKAKAKKPVKPKKPANTNTASPTKKTKAPVPYEELDEKYKTALKLHAEGKSGRAIAAELHMCRNKLSKLIKDYAA